MNRWFMVILLFISQSMFATIARERSGTASATGLAVDCTFSGGSTSAGDLIVVITQGGTVSSVTDPASDGFTAIFNGVGNFTEYLFYAKNAGSVSKVTVNKTPSGTTSQIVCAAYTGVDTTAPLDQSTDNLSQFTSTPSSGNITTTVANELLFGYNVNGGRTSTAGTGYSLIGDTGTAAAEDEIVSATGTYSATFTLSSSGTVDAGIASFKASGSGPPPCANYITLMGAGCK